MAESPPPAKRRPGVRDAFEYWLARGVLASLAALPRSLAFRLGRFYAMLLDRAIPRLRRVALRNLSFALPSADHKQIVDEVFASIGRLLVSLAHFPSLSSANIHEWIRYEGLEHFESALRRGKGVMFATAHLGNWELSAVAHALMTAPMHVVVRPLDNRRIDALVQHLRTITGNRIIEKKDYARAILTALKANQAVGILIDQNAAPESGVFLDFFGVAACASTGFAKIAAHSGAAVIPGFALWSESERRYLLRFYPEIPITGDDEVDTRAIHAQLETVIRQDPGQWLWIHRRWKTRPPGAPPLYD